MGITYHTVNAHIKSIYDKLDITSKSELRQYMLV